MDRVRDAINRAREERQARLATGDPEARPEVATEAPQGAPAEAGGDVTTGVAAVGPVSPVAAPATVADVPVTDIEYTRTRTVALDNDVLERNRVIAGTRSDPRAEVYRQMRSRILAQMKANGWRTLAFTSPGEGAGKTLTAVNLAICISQEVNQTVLLVDLDLRKPAVHARLGLSVEKGLPDCLLDNEPVENVLINPHFKRLVILPGRALGDYSSELLSSPRMQTLVKELVARYESRIILFDLPPLLRNDDALVFTPQTDATLLVIEDGVSTADQVRRCQHLLEGCNVIGTILNKARL